MFKGAWSSACGCWSTGLVFTDKVRICRIYHNGVEGGTSAEVQL